MFYRLLKYDASQPRDDNGRFVVTEGIMATEHGYNTLDRKIIDVKPDRTLSDPKEVQRIDKTIDNARFIPYSDVPFFDVLNELQGTLHPETMTGAAYVAARAKFFNSLPTVKVEMDKLVVTQHIVNKERIVEMAAKLPKDGKERPISAVRYKGETYILDGHHRVVAMDKRGDTMINAHLLKLNDEMRVQKFNANHDERGRFAVAGYGQGIEFVSPNVAEGLDVSRALGESKATRHLDVMAISRQVDVLLGLRTKHESGVGAWSDGAENTMLGRVYGNPSYDDIKLSAAMKGLLADQKAVIPFKVEKGGPDSMYKIKVADTDLEQVHDTFSREGLEFHTMVPHNGHTDVYVFDPGTVLKDKVKSAGDKHGTEVSQWRGRGEFLGSWDTRSEGRAAYEAEISANLGQDRRGQWDRLYSRWRQTYPALKGEVMRLIDILKFDVDQLRDLRGRWVPMGGLPRMVDLTDMSVRARGRAEVAFRASNPHSIAGHYKKAKENDDLLRSVMGALSSSPLCVRAYMGPMKGMDRAMEKVRDKYHGDAGGLTDVVRSTIEVKNVADVAAMAKLLAEKLPTMFEGIAVTGLGYADGKALVKFPNGQLGEVQFVEPNFAVAKFSGYPDLALRPGHDLYYEFRGLSNEEQKGTMGYPLHMESQAVYGEAMRKASRDWENLILRGTAMRQKAEVPKGGVERRVVRVDGHLTVIQIDHGAQRQIAHSLIKGKWVEADLAEALFNGALMFVPVPESPPLPPVY